MHPLSLSIVLDEKYNPTSSPFSIPHKYDRSVRNGLNMCISSVEWLAAEADCKKAR